MRTKFPEFKLEKFRIWHPDETPEDLAEVKQFFERGYDRALLVEAEKAGDAYKTPINDLIHDYRIMLADPDRYGLS